MRRVLSALWTIVDRVVIDQARAGRMRWETWPPGYRAIGVVGALALVAAAAIVLIGSLARPHLTLSDDSLGAAPVVVIIPLMLLLIVTFVFLQAGTLHAPVPLRLVGLLLSLVTLGASGAGSVRTWGADWVPFLVLGLLVVLQIVRWRARPRWWEFALVWALLGVGHLFPPVVGALASRHTIAQSGSTSQLSLVLLAAWAIPSSMVAGAALGEVALSTCLWSVEVATSRFGGVRWTRAALVLILALVLADGAHTWWTLERAWLERATQTVLALGLLGLAVLVWLAVDAQIDRTSIGSTRVHQLNDRLAAPAWILGSVVAVPVIIGVTALVSTVSFVLLAPAEVAAVANRVAQVATSRQSASRFVFELVAVAGLLVLAIVRARRGDRGGAELAGIVGVVTLVHSLRLLDGLLRWEPSDLSIIVAPALAALATTWAARGRLTAERVEALLTAALLTFAVAHLTLISDPFGALLGLAGGGALFLGLLWNGLTSGDLANGDSRRFPQPARILLTFGTLLIAFAYLAAVIATRTHESRATLDSYVRSGTDIAGVAVLVTALVAVLAAAGRREEIIERTGGDDYFPAPPA